MILRARFVVPVSKPPIDDGAVAMRGGRITSVGSWKHVRAEHSGEAFDLGDSVLLPGLINAHCHLDYTDMAGLLTPKRSFSDWIKAIVSLKGDWSYTDFAQSWLNGARQLLRSGTTTVVDIEAVPELIPELPQSTPLRVISCLEMISLRRNASAADLVRQNSDHLARWPNPVRGLSPHAPYTTSLELLWHAAENALANRWLLTAHVAESEEEFQMFTRSRGAMFRWLKTQRDMSDCVGRTPVQHMDHVGALASNVLAAHANAVTDDDITLLARRGAHVVHCPRSHDYFKHQPFRFEDFQKAGVNICLGTDSMASTRKLRGEPLELNLFSEMRTFSKFHPDVSPDDVLRLVTINAARALGLSGEIGELAPGARADIIAVLLDGISDPHEAVLAHKGVVTSIIGGRWIWPPRDNG
ncbi:MAG TPA: amidohydrolase family protein [Candidatus Acidoferrum sp.]|nr:amidohydrolase family protein [Candidatus Acidoferrum sp.]